MTERLSTAERLVRILDGRWTLAILNELGARGLRYQEIRDSLDGIAPKVLTETLRRAERDGLIARRLDSEHVETATLYELTDLGRSLGEPLNAFKEWVGVNWGRVDAARREWDRKIGRE